MYMDIKWMSNFFLKYLLQKYSSSIKYKLTSFHKFLIGLSSGLWLSHFQTFLHLHLFKNILVFWSYTWLFLSWLKPLSWLKRSSPIASKFASNISFRIMPRFMVTSDHITHWYMVWHNLGRLGTLSRNPHQLNSVLFMTIKGTLFIIKLSGISNNL